MDNEKAMLQLTNINLQMVVSQLESTLSTARHIIKKQAQRIHELEASYTSGIKVNGDSWYV
jgi:hypothetical protein